MLTIRHATPEDAPFLGWVCVAAPRSHLKTGWFEIVLRRDEAFCIEFAARLTIARPRSWWHYSLFLIAEVDGTPAAGLCGFGDEGVYMASSDAMSEAAGAMGISKSEQEQFWPRGAYIISPATSESGAWTIENVATKPEFRGRGLVGKLLDAELNEARAAGFKRAQVSFFMGNEAAEDAYTKAGFRFAEEKTARDFEAVTGVAGIRRFARDI